MLHAAIMAGGSGTRFWPLSRAARPKQLLDLTGGRTMLQMTFDRLQGLVVSERTRIITNCRLIDAISQQLPELDRRANIGEPCRRDTAPAVGLAALLALRDDRDATLLMMPADHVIEPMSAFQQAIRQAAALVEADPTALVTFGVKPTYAAESFGYIERGDALTGAGHNPVGPAAPQFAVRRFREKPAKSVAEQYLASGNFYWNSGIFVWKAATIVDALRDREPAMCDHLQAIAKSFDTPQFDETFSREFTAIRGKSIDFAVMEHSSNVVVIEAPFAWDDVGSWQALSRLLDQDDQGNTAVGKHLAVQTTGSIIRSTADHLVVTLGLSNCIVVHTPDATLVADKHQEEAIRKVVQTLEERGWQEYL